MEQSWASRQKKNAYTFIQYRKCNIFAGSFQQFREFVREKSEIEEERCMIDVSNKSLRRVYVSYITLKNGRRIYARQYGKKAFCFLVD